MFGTNLREGNFRESQLQALTPGILKLVKILKLKNLINLIAINLLNREFSLSFLAQYLIIINILVTSPCKSTKERCS